MKNQIPPWIKEGSVVVFKREIEGYHMGKIAKGTFGRVYLVEITDNSINSVFSHSDVHILVHLKDNIMSMTKVAMEVFLETCDIVPEGEATKILYGK